MSNGDHNTGNGIDLPKSVDPKSQKSALSSFQAKDTKSKSSPTLTNEHQPLESPRQSAQAPNKEIKKGGAVDDHNHSPNSRDVIEIPRNVAGEQSSKQQTGSSSSGIERDNHEDEAYPNSKSYGYHPGIMKSKRED